MFWHRIYDDKHFTKITMRTNKSIRKPERHVSNGCLPETLLQGDFRYTPNSINNATVFYRVQTYRYNEFGK